jgi:hypothetical protein
MLWFKTSTITLFVLISVPSLAQIDYKGFPQWSWHKRDSTEYYLYTPDIKPGKKYPVALFLHGCCGTSYKATLRNTVDPPVRMWHQFGENKQSEPTYIISPGTSRGWSQHIDNLKKVIDDLIANHQADPQRIYITGFSMGGAGTVEFITRYPDYFAAALPMGMDFKTDLNAIKYIPIWTNRGETDWWARDLHKAVSEMRRLNGDVIDSAANYVTGVNPRFTSFKGYGHGVQWVAASTQDLTGWAYGKVNDGNRYPNVFFKSPVYKSMFKENEKVSLLIEANDPDGSIKHIEVFQDGKLVKKITAKPYTVSVSAKKGDSHIDAIATDNKAKSSKATTIIRVDIPVSVSLTELLPARQGGYYFQQLKSSGNGIINFRPADNSTLPSGLKLTESGILKGVPINAGNFRFSIVVKDEDGDESPVALTLTVDKKNADEVVVTNVTSYSGKQFPISKVMKGETPHGDRGDDEITFSDVSTFGGLTLIQTDANDTINAQPHYVEFDVDVDVTVFVAYEKLDRLFTSKIPDWLKEFKREDGEQIVTQYFYYDVYSKDFPKGKIVLPDAMENTNGVNTNYFIMIKKQ